MSYATPSDPTPFVISHPQNLLPQQQSGVAAPETYVRSIIW